MNKREEHLAVIKSLIDTYEESTEKNMGLSLEEYIRDGLEMEGMTDSRYINENS